MSKRILASIAVFSMMFLMIAASGVSAQNMLLNPGFEDGPTVAVPPTNWTAFGNAYQEPASPADNRFVPLSGNNLCSMYGNFWGSFNVSGIFQEFPTAEGGTFTLSCNTRFWEGDAMIGSQATGGNWVVQKIAFFDGADPANEIGAVESIVLDGSYDPEVWHYSGEITGIAPAGTVKVQALILYLQPMWDGGAANIDDVVFTYTEGSVAAEETTWGSLKNLDDKE